MSELKNLIKSKIVKNVSWILAGRIYQMVVNLLVSLLTARYLGPSNYGLINYAASCSALMTAFCTLGTNEILVHELVSQKEKTGQILGTTIFFRICSSLLSVCTIILAVFALNHNQELLIKVVAIYSVSLILQSFESIKYWYQANLRSEVPSLITAAAYTVVAVYKIVLLICGKNVLWFAASMSLDYLVIACLYLGVYRKHRPNGQALSISMSLAKQILSRSSPFILSGLMVAIYGQMDKLMLNNLLGETSVGYYSAATTICGLWSFVLGAVIDSVRPIILSSYEQNKKQFNLYLTRLYGIIVYISLTVSLGITVFSKLILFILYGEAYLPAQNALRIVCWYTGFSYLGVARSLYLIPQGKQMYEKRIAVIGVLANLLLNAVLIPSFGIEGAAFATLLTQIITNVILGFFLPDVRENSLLILKSIDPRNLKLKTMMSK